ncbi:hypothetical protein PFICI_14697 [Pestalotiopsis fici W106-1]|uniref:Uncharacterized protein n=1 Tax=Pestalotiopsis fici (strain W106-1 / CGMCC3.15140) TaxID=1229662 RepID=W3WLT1_PESFW|nr:uncharacterized protein PFICI_14697 [Pestalotiopsis fici W106-1]ETS73751.1 hypothetical protein PFICI_14697 [Pestalotiopsis fici W106-1]
MASRAESASHSESTTIPSAQSSSESLWAEALDLLHAEDGERLRLLAAEKITVLDEVLEAAKEKRQQCQDGQWKYKKSDGTVVVLRDVFDKMVKWLTKLQTIGDLVVQFDSTHLTIPWAAIKFFLAISSSDSQNLSAVFDGLEMITNLISRYKIFEELYLREVSKATELLKQAIIKLYASVLTFLAQAKRYYSQNTASKLWRAISLQPLSTLRSVDDKLGNLLVEGKAHQTELRKALDDLRLTQIHGHLSTLLQDAESKSATFVFLQLQLTTPGLKKRQFLNWISPIPYSKHHDNIRRDRIQESGLWIFEQRQYTDWKQSATSSLLWLRGMPGSGKSRLMSLLVDTTRENDINPQAEPFAYFYCDRNGTEPERGNPLAILRSILRQLCCHSSKLKIHDVLARKYHEYEAEDPQLRELPLAETKGLIIEFLKDSPATIMIDALDECAMDLRYELLGAINEIMAPHSKRVKILVSSRDNVEDISSRLEKASNFTLEVTPNAADIETFVRLELDRSIKELRLLNGQVSPELQDTLIQRLTHGAQGMFLWAALQMQNLCSPRIKFEADVLYELQKMPKRLQDVYTDIYEQIQTIAVPSRRIATTALQWLLCAKGRLSSEDFITAVSVSETDTSIRLSAAQLLDICGNLVVLDTDLNVFRFAHLSVREFLEGKPEYAPKLTHATAADICLNTLLTREWLSSEVTWQKATLYRYVTLYWASHIEHCRKDRDKGKIGDALQLSARDDRVTPWFAKWLLQIESASITLGWDDPLKEKIEQSLCHPETCFFTACAFGFLKLVEHITRINPSVTRRKNARGATGLHLASQFGYPEIVRVLLERGAETDTRDQQMETALIHASSTGHEDIVSLLLEKGADRSVQGKRFGNALQAACLHGHEAVVDLLIDDVDIEAEGGQFGTALQAASLRGHENVVQILLRGGAQVNALGGDYNLTEEISQGEPNIPSRVDRALEFLFHKQALLEEKKRPPLSHALFRELTIGRLLDERIDINITKTGFGSALQAAARGGHEKVVHVLLVAGADVDVEGGTYGSATQAAAVSGNEEVIRHLINSGADINVQNGLYNTALQAACRFGNETVVRMLLDYKADVNAQGGVYGSALQAACRAGSIRIIELLLHHGADTNSFGGTYCTPLQAASAKGSLRVVQILLNEGAKVNVRGGQYGSALQAASRGGHLKVVEVLMANGGRPEASLQISAAAGHDKIVEFLLDQGVDPNARQFEAFGSALEIAVAAGREDLAHLLCERGAQADDGQQYFGTALQIATSFGNKKLVRLLLEHGANPGEDGGGFGFGLEIAKLLQGTSDKADTSSHWWDGPLGLASAAGDEEVVQLLLEKFTKSTDRFSFEQALRKAAKNGHLSIVELLLDYQDEIHLAEEVPLEDACAGGHTDIVRFLMDRYADAELHLDESLLEAAEANNMEIARMLLLRGADVGRDHHFAGTVLHMACCNGSVELAQLFLDFGAEVDWRGDAEVTPLMLACARGHDAVVQLLLDHGADPDLLEKQFHAPYRIYKERDFGKPLLAAVHGGHETIVHLLLDHPRYDKNGTTDQDKLIDTCVKEFGTALQVACLKGYTTIIDRLLNQGARTNVCGGQYGSALQAACWKGNEEIVQILLGHGSDINIRGGMYGAPLQAAAAGGHTNLVRLMLGAGAKLKLPAHGKFGSALQAAASLGDLEIVRCLLDHGADVGGKDEHGQTSLHAAAHGGHEAVVKLLLDRGANVNDKDLRGFGALRWVSSHGYENLVGLFFSKGAQRDLRDDWFGWTAMHCAAHNGHLSVLKRLLEDDFEVATKDNNGKTPLFLAAENGKHLAVRLLSNHGAAVDETDSFGRTALHMAARGGHKSTIRVLLQNGAEMEARDRDNNQTPLHFAADYNQYEAAYLLWINGADLNARTAEGDTPLLIAARNNATSVLSLLVIKGADIHVQDMAGRSALHIAAIRRNKEAVQILLDNGATVYDRDEAGCTALYLAVQDVRGLPERLPIEGVMLVLLGGRSDVNDRNKRGRTPLHAAVMAGEKKSVQILLDRGADVSAQDEDGNTALHLAFSLDHTHLNELLVARGAVPDILNKHGEPAAAIARQDLSWYSD